MAKASIVRSPGVPQLLLVTLASFGNFSVLLSSLPAHLVQQGYSISQAGLVTSWMLVATIAVQPFVAILAARWGHLVVLSLGVVLLTVPTIAYPISSDYVLVYGASAIRGIGFAIITVIVVMHTAILAPEGRSGETVGLYGLAISSSSLTLTPLSVILALSGHFLIVCIIGLVCMLAVFAVPGLCHATAQRTQPEPAKQPGARGGNRGVLRPVFVLFMMSVAGGSVMTFFPIQRPDSVTASLGLTLYGLAIALCRWRVGAAADRRSLSGLLRLFIVMGIAGAAVAYVASRTDDTTWWTDAVLIIGICLIGGAHGAIQNLTQVWIFRVTSNKGVASGAWNISFDAGSASGALVIGMIANSGFGFSGSYLFLALIVTLSVLVVKRGA